MNFDQCFDQLIGNEGGYSYSPSDPGGETMFGVTAAVARANGYTGAMRDFPKDSAKAIYLQKYWSPIKADQLPDALRFHVFDAAVNSGVTQAAKWLQRIAGASEDGIIGPATLAAVSNLDGHAAAAAYNGLRLDFMTNLPTWGSFGRGWARRIASNLQLSET
jgi:lysozyme family protein